MSLFGHSKTLRDSKGRFVSPGESKSVSGFWSFDAHKMQKRADRGQYRSLGHWASSLRRKARESIEKAPGPSLPGTPPHTHRGRRLPRSILFARDPLHESYVVGASHPIMGIGAAAHEHGGRREGQTFLARPFMAPALEATIPRAPRRFAGLLKR
jgi:hypothetical protein